MLCDIAKPKFIKALDPRYKLRYFHDEGWLTGWIEEAKKITRSVFDKDYPSLATTEMPASPRKPRAPSGDWESLLRKKHTTPILRTHERDELAAFWGSPCEPDDVDPLLFWQGVLMGRPESQLAKMAIDYLSTPASSVDAERAFSRGALTVTHHRHSLSDVSTRNSIVLGAWLQETNLVPTLDLIEFFRKKTDRSQSVSTRGSVGADDADCTPDPSNESDTDA